MNKKTWGVLAVVILGLAVTLGIILSRRSALNQIYEASAVSGGIAEHIVGNPDAPVKIFEYADYQCAGCASLNPKLNALVEEYGGEVAVVFRLYIQSYHQNGVAAASAAEAAGLQGYWKEYKDYLFQKQTEWHSSDAATRQRQFEDYFMEITAGKGDLEKFRQDMLSEEVARKIEFDAELSRKVDLSYTPLIFVNDERISKQEMGANLTNVLRSKINRLLSK